MSQLCSGRLHKFTWYHNFALLEKIKNPAERLWYARATVEHGWSRTVLVHWIESDLYQRQGKATTNFVKSLPSPQSDLAHEILKDPYKFEFLSLAKDARNAPFRKGCWSISTSFSSNWGPASPSSASNSASKSAAKTSASIYYFII